MKLRKCLLVLMGMVVMAAPVMAYADVAPVKTINRPNTEAFKNGKEVDYFIGPTGDVRKDMPKVVKTAKIQGNGKKTLKYEVTRYTNEKERGLNIEYKLLETGAYIEIDNIVKETSHDGHRLLYSDEPVNLKFITKGQLRGKKVTKYERYKLENGKLMYRIGYDYGKEIKHYKEIKHDFSNDDLEYTLSEPGLYFISIGTALSGDAQMLIYIGKDISEFHHIPLKNESAYPASLSVKVNGKDFKVPAYSVNNESYVKIDDLGYILKGTKAKFHVIDQTGVIDAASTIRLRNDVDYEVIGGELTKLPMVSKVAKPSKIDLSYTSDAVYPKAYNIRADNYISLKDMAKILDIELSWDPATKVTSIDTNKGYKW